MVSLLTRIFIKDYKNLKDPKVRRDYGILTAVVGIVLNSFVFTIKAIAGFTTGSVAIVNPDDYNLSTGYAKFKDIERETA